MKGRGGRKKSDWKLQSEIGWDLEKPVTSKLSFFKDGKTEPWKAGASFLMHHDCCKVSIRCIRCHGWRNGLSGFPAHSQMGARADTTHWPIVLFCVFTGSVPRKQRVSGSQHLEEKSDRENLQVARLTNSAAFLCFSRTRKSHTMDPLLLDDLWSPRRWQQHHQQQQ